MKVYYAHPLNIYNTKQEIRDLDALYQMFGEDNVINPNDKDLEKEYFANGMEVFFNIVRDCDVVAFRATPSGKITAGVAAEINVAIQEGKLVIELPSLIGRTMTIDETRQYLREVGQR